jgi:hypothetical protein
MDMYQFVIFDLNICAMAGHGQLTIHFAEHFRHQDADNGFSFFFGFEARRWLIEAQ